MNVESRGMISVIVLFHTDYVNGEVDEISQLFFSISFNNKIYFHQKIYCQKS